jgi:hypothetical protein
MYRFDTVGSSGSDTPTINFGDSQALIEERWIAEILDQYGSPADEERHGHPVMEQFRKDADTLPDGLRQRVLRAAAVAMREAAEDL